MNVPVLRKTIRLSHLPAATIPVRAVVPFDERRVDFVTAFRRFQRFGDLLFRAEHPSTIYFRHATLFPRLVDRRIDQSFFRTINSPLRSSGPSRAFRRPSFAERLQNRLFVRLVLVARNQTRTPEIQSPSRFPYQQFRILLRPLAVDDLQDEFVFGVQGDMVPVVAASGVSRIVFVAIFLFLFHEVPVRQETQFVELDFLRPGGKLPRAHHEALRHVLRQVACSGSRFANVSFPIGLSSSCRSPRRRVRGGRRLFPSAIVSRRKPSHDVRRIFLCSRCNTATAFSFPDHTTLECGYFLLHDNRISRSFYSGNKSFSNRP